MKGNRLLFGIVVVLLLVTSVLPGCNEGQPTEADKLVIPSSMSPYQVFNETANAGPCIKTWPFFQGNWTAKYIEPCCMPEGAPEEQFIKGFGADLSELLYIKRDGRQAGLELFKIASYFAILKYEDAESATRSFINISDVQGFQSLTYEGIALKNGTHTLNSESPERAYEIQSYWDESTMPCYLVQSSPFVIYLYGREEVANDMLDRIIVAFGVESSSNQSQAGNTT